MITALIATGSIWTIRSCQSLYAKEENGGHTALSLNKINTRDKNLSPMTVQQRDLKLQDNRLVSDDEQEPSSTLIKQAHNIESQFHCKREKVQATSQSRKM